MRRTSRLSWLWLVLVGIFMLAPLLATLQLSLQAEMRSGVPISLKAYVDAVSNPRGIPTFDFIGHLSFSFFAALLTIVISTLLLVPTAYWTQLKLPFLIPVMEFLTLLPIVIPVVVLVFGLETVYRGQFLTNSTQGLYWLMIGANVVITFPYSYRPINTALQAINVKTLTEASQSLGAGWANTLFAVIFPNIWVGVLNGAFITFAIVMGEFTISSILGLPTFSVLMYSSSTNQVYQPAALTIISFGITWASIALLQFVGRRSAVADLAGAR
ncbi:MAG TPA: hypothetical protein VMT34_04975 [Aggregatilineales bacterium]|nr:hypothetical protein [Aggregatilineales bacterium]